MLVNNAGVGGNGVVEEASIERYAEVMNVNLYGALRCLKDVLPGMRQRRSGTIVNITSVAGRFGSSAQAPYVASKWALEGISEELAFELAAFGIRVRDHRARDHQECHLRKEHGLRQASDYEPHWRRMFQFYAAGHANASDPFDVASVVYDAITTDSPKLRYGGVLGRTRDHRPPPAHHRRAMGRPRPNCRRRRVLRSVPRHLRYRHRTA